MQSREDICMFYTAITLKLGVNLFEYSPSFSKMSGAMKYFFTIVSFVFVCNFVFVVILSWVIAVPPTISLYYSGKLFKLLFKRFRYLIYRIALFGKQNGRTKDIDLHKGFMWTFTYFKEKNIVAKCESSPQCSEA